MQRRPERLRYFCEGALPLVSEHMRRLGVLNPVLNVLDRTLEMSIGDKDVEPAIEIVIEKETTEAKRQQTGASNSGTRRFVDKEAVALVVIQSEHLVGEIGNQHTW